MNRRSVHLLSLTLALVASLLGTTSQAQPVINEFVLYHEAGVGGIPVAGAYDFVELYWPSLPEEELYYTLVVIDGNRTPEGRGIIRYSLVVDPSFFIKPYGMDGYWTTRPVAGFTPPGVAGITNGTVTIVLLEGDHTGTLLVGRDFDLDNDGTLNEPGDFVFPVASVVDSIATLHGTRGPVTYLGAPVLTVNYDLINSAVHGASRIPDGDSNWIRNSFNGAGLSGEFSASLVDPLKTVYNTPWGTNGEAPLIAANDAFSTPEDTSVTGYDVLANDALGVTPTGIISVSDPTHGTAAFDPGGLTVSYTPDANFHGSDSFTYTMVDSSPSPQTDTGTVLITVTPVNDAPVATDDSYSLNEDSSLNVAAPGVMANDTDVDGDSLGVSLLSGVSHGTLSLSSNGSFRYTPTGNYNGADSFSYTLSDGYTTDTAVVSITVVPVNDGSPNAQDDTFAVNEDSSFSNSVSGNDTVADLPATWAISSNATYGALSFSSNGSFRYTPNANFNGADSFVYSLTDVDLEVDTATVSITVNPINDCPVANDDSYSTLEDVAFSVSAPGVLGNDTDIDGPALNAVAFTGPLTRGTLALTANGSFTYTPNANVSGTDTYTYTVSDGTCTDTAVLTIVVDNINDPPVANDDAYTTDEDTLLSIFAPGLLTNDTDNDSISIIVSPLTPVTGPSFGSLTLQTTGAFTYSPSLNFNGVDSFTYILSDGSDTDTAVVTINVVPVNDCPIASDDAFTTDENTLLEFTTGDLLANDTDVEGTLVFESHTNPATGNLTLSGSDFDFEPNAEFEYLDDGETEDVTFEYYLVDGTCESPTATVTITVHGVNDAPVGADDSYTTVEDTTLTVAAPGVLSNDTDVDDSALTVNTTPVTGVTSGTLALAANGSFVYTPNADFFGSDSFTYEVSDGTATDTQVVSISVTAANDCPVAAADPGYTTDEDVALVVAAPGLWSNDTDVDDTSLSVVTTPVTGVSHGTLALAADGSFVYTPDANWFGTDSFTYEVSDGDCSDSAVATIEVASVDDFPVAVDDSYSVNEDQVLGVAAAGVLANDTNGDGGTTLTILTPPSSGSAALANDGSFIYTPNANFNGSDSFVYQLADGDADTDTATVAITVISVDDLPVAVDDGVYTVYEEALLSVIPPGVLANDSYVDGFGSVVSGNGTHGEVNLNGTTGAFDYTPVANFFGSDSFVYTLTDADGDTDTAVVSIQVINVPDAPVASDDSYSTDEDVALVVVAPGVLANDTDVDGDSLIASILDLPATGTISFNANGSFVYTPNANYNGSDSFTYTVTDGGLTDTATVMINIDPVDDLPVAVDDGVYTVYEEALLSVLAPGVLANDSYVDGFGSVVSGNGTHGEVNLNGTTGAFDYTPVANFFGSDSFSYTLTDADGDTATAVVSIQVINVPDAPVASDDSYSTDEDVALVVVAPGVLANDTDVDGDSLTASILDLPAAGALSFNANGSFTYTPSADYHGSDSFTYTVSDGTLTDTATVFINIDPVNDAPVAVDDSYTAYEDEALVVAAAGVLANDTDVDGDSLTVLSFTSPSFGVVEVDSDGSFVYTPDTDYNGSDSFTYVATDGTLPSGTATVWLIVEPANDAPIAADDNYSTDEDVALVVTAPGLLVNDTDTESATLSVINVVDPSNGTLAWNSDGSFVYTPDLDFNGSDSFTYQAFDGDRADTATVFITVNPVNDCPVAVEDSAYTTSEDVVLSVALPGVLGNDTDVDDTLITVITSSDPSGGVVAVAADGSFFYTPDADFNGTDSFTYDVSDGTCTGTGVVTVTVEPVNDCPVANADNYSIDEDVALTDNVLTNDTDVDLDDLDVVLPLVGPSAGAISLDTATGAFTYTPSANFYGQDSFTYTVTDGTCTATAVVTIDVASQPDTLQAIADVFTIDEDTNLSGDLTADNSLGADQMGDTPTVVAQLLYSGTGTLQIDTSGAFAYTPAADFFGVDSFTYSLTDDDGDSSSALVTVNVTGTDDQPMAVDDAFSTDEDLPLTMPAPGVLGNDTNPDGGTVLSILGLGPTYGDAALADDGSFVYTPDADFTGSDSFTYQLADSDGDTATAVVNLTVDPVEDSPAAVDDAYSTDEDTTLVVAVTGVLGNDTNPDGGTVLSILDGPSHGSAALANDGSFVYTPTADFNGADSFTYQLADTQGDTATAVVSLAVDPVNDLPDALDDAFALDEDSATTGNVADDNGSGEDYKGDLPATFSVLADVTSGSLALNSDGSFAYTPTADFFGTDSFTYTLADANNDTDTAVVTFTVNVQNDPVIARDDAYSIDEGNLLVVAVPGVLVNDSAVDGGTTLQLVSNVSHGTLDFKVDGSFNYTPTGAYNGQDSFTYNLVDTDDDSDTAVVTIDVTAFNDPPDASDDAYTILEDAVLTVAAPGILSNDTDSDGPGALEVAEILDGPTNGDLAWSSDGSFTYTPDAEYYGTDSFTYVVSDTDKSDTAVVTINITEVQEPPVLSATYYPNPVYVYPNRDVVPIVVFVTDEDDPTNYFGAPIENYDTETGVDTVVSPGKFRKTAGTNVNLIGAVYDPSPDARYHLLYLSTGTLTVGSTVNFQVTVADSDSNVSTPLQIPLYVRAAPLVDTVRYLPFQYKPGVTFPADIYTYPTSTGSLTLTDDKNHTLDVAATPALSGTLPGDDDWAVFTMASVNLNAPPTSLSLGSHSYTGTGAAPAYGNRTSWSPFTDGYERLLSYWVTVPTYATGKTEFTGRGKLVRTNFVFHGYTRIDAYPVTDYTTWSAAYEVDDGADTDVSDDGLPNFLSYALGVDPAYDFTDSDTGDLLYYPHGLVSSYDTETSPDDGSTTPYLYFNYQRNPAVESDVEFIVEYQVDDGVESTTDDTWYVANADPNFDVGNAPSSANRPMPANPNNPLASTHDASNRYTAFHIYHERVAPNDPLNNSHAVDTPWQLDEAWTIVVRLAQPTLDDPITIVAVRLRIKKGADEQIILIPPQDNMQ